VAADPRFDLELAHLPEPTRTKMQELVDAKVEAIV